MRTSIKLAKDYGGKRKWTMGFDNRIFTVRLDDEAIEQLRSDPLVKKVVVSGKARILQYPIPAYDYGAVNEDWGVTRLFPSLAWAKGIYGQGIKVCVIDSGISRSAGRWAALYGEELPSSTSRFGEGEGEKSHPAFWKAGVSVYKGGYDFVEEAIAPDYGYFANDDGNGHGTWTSGIIAEQHSGIVGRYKGIAPGVDLYHCKVLNIFGEGDWADVAAAVDWARTNGMDIISMSLGGAENDVTLQAACNAARNAGILIVAAAGNDGPGENTVNFPGALSACVAVAAADYYENVAAFSSRGAAVDLAAPGVDISGPLTEYWANYFYHYYPDLIIPGSGGPGSPSDTIPGIISLRQRNFGSLPPGGWSCGFNQMLVSSGQCR